MVLSLLVTLAILGFVAWLLVSFVPMPEPYKRILVGVAVLVAVILVLRWALAVGGIALP
jgi:hypothetical protein